MWLSDAGTASTVPSLLRLTRPDAGLNTAWVLANTWRGITIPGVTQTVYDVRGLSGTTVAGEFNLIFTSSVGLVRFNTVQNTFSLIATPCATDSMRFQGVAIAPSLPTPSSSMTASPTATMSFGTSPTQTSTMTPTRTATTSTSATPTPPCLAPATVPAPFQPSSVVVLRVGDGRYNLNGVGSAAAGEFRVHNHKTVTPRLFYKLFF